MKTSFYICPIGDKGTSTREWSDQIFDYIVTPVAAELGYESTERSDRWGPRPSITFEIMNNLVEADLVIADFTEGNPNVFYELAIRHALKRPVVHMIHDGDKIPFDVKDISVIPVNIDTPRNTDTTKKELKSYIQHMEKEKVFLLPYIDSIIGLKNIFESGKSTAEKEDLIDLLGRLDSIQSSVNEVRTDLMNLARQLTLREHKDKTDSPFINKRLAKKELEERRRKPRKKANKS